jgi:DNA-binding SARP family transcriptional activator
MIRLRVLGPVELRDDEGNEYRNVLAQPKRLALLTTLVVGPAGFRRRDSLLALLWPDHDQAHARAALNQALRFLRKELGGSTEAGILSRGADEIGIDTSAVWCDAMEFREHVEAGRHQNALALYRGNLLDGFFFDDGDAFQEWLERERELLRQTASKAARAVVGIHERVGDLTPAVAAARRAVDLSDGDERVLRELLQLLDRVGDRAGALQAYQEFARRLETEYGASPAPETQAVIEDIRTRRHAGSTKAPELPYDATKYDPASVSDGNGRLATIADAKNKEDSAITEVSWPLPGRAAEKLRLPALLLQRSPWVIAGVAIGVMLMQCGA